MPRILIVEDDPNNRVLFQRMLRQERYHTESAHNGLEAVEMWENGSYDLIIMDVQMPVMDGITATRTIRERERTRGGHIPILAITAHAYRQDEEWCLETGMDAYLAKPVEIAKLIDVIEQLVRGAGVATPKPYNN